MTRGVPSVSVPVLSKATAVTVPAASRWAPPLMSTPWRLAAPMADTMATGVEITRAHGQARISRARALYTHSLHDSPSSERRQHGREQRHRHHRGGVVAGERVHPALGGGLLSLGLLHHLDESRERGVPGEGGHAHFERSPLVDGARVDQVVLRLRPGDGFARDGRFVHRRAPFDDDPIERDTRAGSDQYDLPYPHLVHGHGLLVVFVPHQGFVGSEVHELLDRPAGTVHRPSLQRLAEPEEGHHERGLHPRPHSGGADRGYGHKHVHVHVPGADQRVPCVTCHGVATYQRSPR